MFELRESEGHYYLGKKPDDFVIIIFIRVILIAYIARYNAAILTKHSNTNVLTILEDLCKV